jgi:hypothetical protein
LVQPFGPAAKLAALQLLGDDMKPLDLGLCCGEDGAQEQRNKCARIQRLPLVRREFPVLCQYFPVLS